MKFGSIYCGFVLDGCPLEHRLSNNNDEKKLEGKVFRAKLYGCFYLLFQGKEFFKKGQSTNVNEVGFSKGL